MQQMTTQARASHARAPTPIDYSQWSIEELMQLASQLRVPGARGKSRRELIDFFAVSPNSARR
jgi:hypothetical protein